MPAIMCPSLWITFGILLETLYKLNSFNTRPLLAARSENKMVNNAGWDLSYLFADYLVDQPPLPSVNAGDASWSVIADNRALIPTRKDLTQVSSTVTENS